NLVRYGELHCENDQWFFTMELVDGVPFDRYVRTDAAERARVHGSGAMDATTKTLVAKPHSGPSSGDTTSTTVLDKPRSERSSGSRRERVDGDGSPAFDEAKLRAS